MFLKYNVVQFWNSLKLFFWYHKTPNYVSNEKKWNRDENITTTCILIDYLFLSCIWTSVIQISVILPQMSIIFPFIPIVAQINSFFELVDVVKEWLKIVFERDILGSFHWTCIFTDFLQHHVVSKSGGEGTTLQQPRNQPQLKSHHQHER